jgi:hypothetical protein
MFSVHCPQDDAAVNVLIISPIEEILKALRMILWP